MGRQSHQCHIPSSRQKSSSQQHGFERTIYWDIPTLHTTSRTTSVEPRTQILLRIGTSCPHHGGSQKMAGWKSSGLPQIASCGQWGGRNMVTRAVSQHPFCPSRAGACGEARKMAQKIPSPGALASHATEIASDPSAGQLTVTRLTALNLRQ